MCPPDEPIGEDIFTSPLGVVVESSSGVFPGGGVSYLLREDGFRFLREDGGFIVRET